MIAPLPLSSMLSDTCKVYSQAKAGREKGGGGGGEGSLRMVKVFIESMPGALASHVCKCVCEVFQRIYKRDGAPNTAVQ